MRYASLVPALAPLLLLGACATATVPNPKSAEPVAANSPYGLFLAGTSALTAGRNSEAEKFLEQAKAQGGDDPAVVERAFTAALLAGNIEQAARLAPDGEGVSDQGRRMGRMVRVVEALATGKGKLAKEALGTDGIGFPHRSAVALLSPWIAASVGDLEGSLVRPTVRGDAGVDYFGQIGQAHLFERARRFDEAETDFKAISVGDAPSEIAILAYGPFLERRGRRPEAVALYDAGLARNPSHLGLRAARARAGAGKSAPPVPTIREGASLALLAPAATLISGQQSQIGQAYLNLALRLDPQRNDGWLMLGDVLQRQGNLEGARAAYGRPKANAPEFSAAQAKLAWSYQNASDKPEALRLARNAAATGDPEGRAALADILAANESYAEAITIWDGLITASRAPPWPLYYARGLSLERLGDWNKATVDLARALALRPDEPELLNALGYGLIDRGERLPEALAMVERAVAINPRSGAIIDSLGWAHYRMGNYPKAVELLEQAIQLQAGDPEINNHLGDAYWRVGRKDEAVFQWRRVLTVNPDAKIRADAEKKLESGLGPAAKLAEQ